MNNRYKMSVTKREGNRSDASEKQGVNRWTVYSHRPVVECPVKWTTKFKSYTTIQLTASCGRLLNY
jgi:hypothetical protein